MKPFTSLPALAALAELRRDTERPAAQPLQLFRPYLDAPSLGQPDERRAPDAYVAVSEIGAGADEDDDFY